MTKEEILAMEPGSDRKLDILVHEQIMHRTVPVDHDITNRFCDCVPRYSIDISAAWEVLEKILKEPRLLISLLALNVRPFWWSCMVDSTDKDGHVDRSLASVSARTAPEAICKTALIVKLDARERQ